jgi:hypothetical protein
MQSSPVWAGTNKLREFIRMQDAGQQLQTIDDPWPRSGKIGIRINNMDPAVTRRRKRLKPRKSLEQIVVNPRPIYVVSTERQDDDLRLGV